MEKFDVIVIGQGYAGLTAARLAIQRGLRTANVEAALFGGLIINVNDLDPVPVGAEHSGAELASNIAMDNMDKGVVTVSEAVTSVERGGDGLWSVKTDSDSYTARHVVVASGAHLRKLDVPGEADFFGQGVSECADCDGPLFNGMETVIVGGGNSAFQEAIALSQFASKVTMVMRGAVPRARADLVEQAAANPKLTRLTNTKIVAINGVPGKGVESVRIVTDGQGEKTLPTSGVFAFIGLEPNTGFLSADVQRDAAGALITSDQCATALPGLWAIGAVRSGYGGLLTDAAADAERVIAALN
jgi:thioredoxin reductase (NADPH)